MRFVASSSLFSIVAAALAFAPSVTLAAPPQYQVQELGLAFEDMGWDPYPLPQPGFSYSKINAAGDIALTGRRDTRFTVLVHDSSGLHDITLQEGGTGPARVARLQDMDDQGRIVGSGAMSAPGIPQGGFLFDHGEIHDIGNFGNNSWPNESFPRAINNHGQVVGATLALNGTAWLGRHAFLYQDGLLQDLGAFGTDYFGRANSEAFDINDLGQIVGTADVYDATGLNYLGQRAFLYQNGELTSLGTFGDDIIGPPDRQKETALFINNRGDIVIRSVDFAPHLTKVVLLSGGQTIDLTAMVDSGIDRAIALNEAGQVLLIGGVWGQAANVWVRAYMYDNGVMHSLGAPRIVEGRPEGSFYALGMNETGDVVGHDDLQLAIAYLDGDLYHVQDLLPAGSPQMIAATSIADDGKIVAFGAVDNDLYAYLLTPVPEPATLLLALCGAVAVVMMRRRFSR